MNDLINSIAAVAEEYGNLAIFVTLRELLAVEVQEDACCVLCQRKAQWMHGELSKLLARFENEFPATQAVARVNHPGSALVQ